MSQDTQMEQEGSVMSPIRREGRDHALLADLQRRARQNAQVHEGQDDPRWAFVNDETLVWFDDAWITWGELDRWARKTVTMLSDGRLTGGYGV